jgi:hypothetical protein
MALQGTAHVHAAERWRHGHVFLGADHARNVPPQPPTHYKPLLLPLGGLLHITVKVQPCDEGCLGAPSR